MSKLVEAKNFQFKQKTRGAVVAEAVVSPKNLEQSKPAVKPAYTPEQMVAFKDAHTAALQRTTTESVSAGAAQKAADYMDKSKPVTLVTDTQPARGTAGNGKLAITAAATPFVLATLAGCTPSDALPWNWGQSDQNQSTSTEDSSQNGKTSEKKDGDKVKTQEWPTTAAEAAKMMGLESEDAKYIVKGKDGVWDAEFFLLKDGVTYNEVTGIHEKDGKTLTNPNDIFDFAEEPIWHSVRNDSEGGILFARSGGAADSEANTSRFIGVGGSADGDNIEQAALIPVPKECIDDTHTAAWRHALTEFTWNQAAQKKEITVEWYNPRTEKMQKIDGKMISAIARALPESEKEVFVETLKNLPAGYPITPEQVNKIVTGGQAKVSSWTFNFRSGEWYFEGFKLKAGYKYDVAKGLIVNTKNGKPVLEDTRSVYDYANWSAAQAGGYWPRRWNMGDFDGDTYGFARTGGGASPRNTSWYGQEMTVSASGIEQGTIIPIDPGEQCTPSDDEVKDAMTSDAEGQAQNKEVRAVYVTEEVDGKLQWVKK